MLPHNFYTQNTHDVARGLLGKLLIRQWRDKKYIARICEVESYIGQNDQACHASKGKTKRTEVMFGPPGHAYIYLIYGMYHCLNIVTEPKDFPAAVLIRSAVPIQNIHRQTNGPGKLTREMKITKTLNQENVTASHKLYICQDNFQVSKKDIATGPRIGVTYAGPDALLPWRYYLKK